MTENYKNFRVRSPIKSFRDLEVRVKKDNKLQLII